jgi:multidrug efflux system membrane fusion protein
MMEDVVHPTREPSRALISRRTKLILAVAALAAIIAAVWFMRSSHEAAPKGRGGARGGMPVVAATAVKGEVKVTYDALGSVTPLANITVKSQVNGQLMRIGYQEGQIVHKDDFLAQIDPRPYEATLKQAEGNQARDQALLEAARVDLKRYETLVAQDSIAQQQFDTQRALVHQYEGTVKTDEGVVDIAKVNLLYTHITAPVTGRVGLRLVDPGNYVQTSDASGVVTIAQTDPISVIFSVPEDNVPQIMARMQSGASLEVIAYDRSGTTQLATGKVSTIDNQIDVTTGTVKLRALFDNKEFKLYPNQFVNARLLIDTLHDAIVIPGSAVLRGAPGTYVYVVKPDNTVSVRPVTLGPAQGERQAVLTGLQAGDSVVVDGSDKLREGAKVTLPGADDAAGGKGAGGTGKHGKSGDKDTPEGSGKHRKKAGDA